MPGQLIHYDQETGDTIWFIGVPGSPNEPGWFGAPGGELIPGSPVVYVPGYRPDVYSTWDGRPSEWKRIRVSSDPETYFVGPRLPGGEILSKSQGLVHPVAASPTRTTHVLDRVKSRYSKRQSESRKTGKTTSAHGRRKQTSVSARGKCPKGHYWSYKQKKCVKSKFT